MNKRPLIIDTDPGIDDALAIAIALFSDEDVYKRQISHMNIVKSNLNIDRVKKLCDVKSSQVSYT